jgi:transcriptional regulator with XRE-family HTH domain
VINANQLKKARLKAGLTQGQVAKKMNYHPLYYSRVEKGHVNPSDAFLVAAGRCLFGPRALQKEYKTR